jgi:hypothetical protein
MEINLGQLAARTDWLYILLLFSAYAAIPAIPAAALRIKAPAAAYKAIITIGVALLLFCSLFIMLAGQEMLEDNEGLAAFAQYATASTVPALFCAALVGKGKKIWFAVVPSIVYFLVMFMRYFMTVGFQDTLVSFLYLEYMFFDGILAVTLGMSAIFLIWSLACIFAAKLIYKLVKYTENKLDEKSTDPFGRNRRKKRKK